MYKAGIGQKTESEPKNGDGKKPTYFKVEIDINFMPNTLIQLVCYPKPS